MVVNSKQQKLNVSQIIMLWLKDNPQPQPDKVILPAIIAELSHANVQTKQIGNTVFETIIGQNQNAFVKAFNADTGANFVDNTKMFLVYAKRVLGLKDLVTQFSDPVIEQLIKIISMNFPMPGMKYKIQRLKSGETRIILNLGA